MGTDGILLDPSIASGSLDKQVGCGSQDELKIKSLKELVAQLLLIFQSDHVNVEEVHRLMAAYEGDLKDWETYANYDSEKLTRNLVDSGNGKFNLILVCWEGGHSSTIHDHANCHCFMRQLQGTLNEVRYQWPDPSTSADSPLQEITRSKLCCPEVSYINDDIGLHRMENASQEERAVSLHLYCPPINVCKVFDKGTGKSIKCRITFWSKYGKKTEV